MLVRYSTYGRGVADSYRPRTAFTYRRCGTSQEGAGRTGGDGLPVRADHLRRQGPAVQVPQPARTVWVFSGGVLGYFWHATPALLARALYGVSQGKCARLFLAAGRRTATASGA
jgi:hypothetical protein